MMKSRLVLSALLTLIPSLASAQGAAPALYNVKDVVLQYATFSNPKTAEACGFSREELALEVIKILQDDNVPAVMVTDTKPPMMGVARISLVPEISSIENQGLDCTSWVSLTARTQSNVVVPPITEPRNVTVIYWRQGTLVSSGLSTHARIVGETLEKMAKQFAQQYRIDQPPEIPAKR